MTKNNLYMDDDNMRLYVDVQPLFIDELENSKNSAAASAASAAQSEANARTWKNDIIDYKTNLELFYAQARDGITNSYNNSVSDLASARNLALNDLNTQKNSIQTNLNNSLNSALNSITISGQNYVNSAREYAEQAQTVVDNRVSKDLLIQSNAYKTGSISTNNEVLADVKDYAHSTFDGSKFTVVGSPRITDDGIASGFSSGNYINCPDYSGVNRVDFYLRVTLPEDFSTGYGIIGQFGNFTLSLLQSGALNWYLGYAWDYVSNIRSLTPGKTYDIHMYKILNDHFAMYLKEVGETEYTNGRYESKSSLSLGSVVKLGASQQGDATNVKRFDGSIDLKQFSVTVDGVEVFSGNKTGIDTIKPDDYTVVGSPTISADGIASGFSLSNYLTIPAINVSGKDFEIDLGKILSPTNFNVTKSYIGGLQSGGVNLSGFSININTGGKITASSLGVNFATIYSDTINVDTYYYVKAGVTGSNAYLKVSQDNQTWKTYTSPITTAFTQINECVGIGWNSNPVNRPINLNTIKIVVGGDIVYQPCLKIPYTESKTGSKIVNAIYRDRVNDMAEQFGYAPYYTLSDTDFSLPQVELYGNVRMTLRDSSKSGINRYFLFSERTQLLTGSCTSGTEVTLNTPFSDANYMLSVPYSAKSATAFTPTQTGDWFAIGEGAL